MSVDLGIGCISIVVFLSSFGAIVLIEFCAGVASTALAAESIAEMPDENSRTILLWLSFRRQRRCLQGSRRRLYDAHSSVPAMAGRGYQTCRIRVPVTDVNKQEIKPLPVPGRTPSAEAGA
ncbi:hypothetical protein [Rhodocyclus tenuis]|uniref:hypothetical protein n=1 Tax=Rhodocyclus tenuis TaxID=1066 RepID=UPI001292AA53|nr:hypothetical protein [Rhodocyclus tenuis]